MGDIKPIKSVDVSLMGGNGKYRVAVTVLDADGCGCPVKVEIIDENGVDRGGEISDPSGSCAFPINVDKARAHMVVEVFVHGFIPERGKKMWRFDLYGKRPNEPVARIDPKKVPRGPFGALFYGLFGKQEEDKDEHGNSPVRTGVEEQLQG